MRKTKRTDRRLRQVLLGVLLIGSAAVSPVASASEADRLFRSDEVLEVTLTGPLRALARDRNEVPELRPATLSYVDADGATRTLNVTLEPRGKSRRDRAVCTFPPLWVHFDKDAVKETLFAKQKRLKMVTYCRSPESFQNYVLKEYLAYRIFNRLTDASFRVRLLRVNFTEAEGGRDLTRYAFFIEHKKRLAKRLDTKEFETDERIPVASLEPTQATIAEVYQYMVSNTDFSFIAPPVDDDCCHNAILLEGGNGTYLPVPYDFDRTGLVDPPNGEPAAELNQRSFRDRVFRGFCRDPGDLEAAIARTRTERAAIEALVRDQEGLSDRARSQALGFIESYYDVVNDPGRRERELKCRDVS